MSAAGQPHTQNTITGGVFFNTVVQGSNVTVVLPPAVTPALSGLPQASTSFTGRDIQLGELLQALVPAGEGGGAPVLVSATVGLAGVGKTELVVQAAHRAMSRPGWFCGGVLFVDLFGYDPDPAGDASSRRVSTGEVLGGLLQALGMPGEYVPAGVQDRSRLFRSVLAAYAGQGKRILLVIDNAATVGQVAPLLPGDGVTATLVTSRDNLDIEARRHELKVLDREASVRLLADVLRRVDPADTRIRDEADAAGRVADLCAGLPLALRIVAARLASRRTRPVADLAEALAAEHTRLDQLQRADRAVRAAFDLSYRTLTPRHATLFRRLPVNPGPDISVQAAARLVDLDPAATDLVLEELSDTHLIEPGTVWNRWRMHDLVRLYAAQHPDSSDDQHDQALTRLLAYYRTTTEAAKTHLQQPPPEALSSRFGDRAAALAWLDSERVNLIAACTTAATHTDHHTTSIRLAFDLAQFLDFRRRFDDWITITTTALHLLRQTGDRHGEGTALNNLGLALQQVRRFQEAITAHQQDLAICREIGHRHGEGTALNSLGLALRQVRRFQEAITAHQQATDIYRETGDRHSEGTALNNLGLALQQVRRFQEAITAHQQDLAICREIGDRHGEGRALNNLGSALQQVRRFEEAITAYQQAAGIFREIGDRHGEGTALNNLGSALQQVRRFDKARSSWTKAVEAFTDTGDAESAALVKNWLTEMDGEDPAPSA
ncbi:hypothetical protein GCM10010123_46150 [Pilimelia anulata]|uniref:Uncharacterized protein n=1 Tax=Pilimelia anulata TaxID=53371 RepID=A0A8J3BC70_9ACTN|nr:tetratricopeptide repeat protein [Pilimelia anulata]GGK10964.1 hypothetical protein GCM10010123_46150 [Pilimelia anulata]